MTHTLETEKRGELRGEKTEEPNESRVIFIADDKREEEEEG